MKAIDLYSGIGGWAIGLKLAGIKVIKSYEYWEPAARTHESNLKGSVVRADIRQLRESDLPSDVDIVVGSPPCTQFSFSNRGGQGDISDGLEDVYKFFQIVRWLKPKWWAFENVPRVQRVIAEQSQPGGSLVDFADIIRAGEFHVIDFSQFGIPQKRKRCIGGNFDFNILNSYRDSFPRVTLGEVLAALHVQKSDPIYPSDKDLELTDMDYEDYFTMPEIYYNRAAKISHPVYNRMSFPEKMDEPARTVTATCTRVSRESAVIEAPESPGNYRRLNVRERLSIQSFPTSYSLIARSYAEKLKMAGNAIPPAFTFLLANAMRGEKTAPRFPKLSLVEQRLIKSRPSTTLPDGKSMKYRANRRFRFSIPNLNFKSGTQFELSNDESGDNWSVKFFFGNSKAIRMLELSDTLYRKIKPLVSKNQLELVADKVQARVKPTESKTLQSYWTSESDQIRLFKLIDDFGDLVHEIEPPHMEQDGLAYLIDEIAGKSGNEDMSGIGLRKVNDHIDAIYRGICLGLVVNKLVIDPR